jgi:hypothetical protein
MLVPNAWLASVADHDVTLQHYPSGREWTLKNIDCIVHAGNRHSCDALYGELKGRVPELFRTGDAYMPRRIADAIREGHRVGRDV